MQGTVDSEISLNKPFWSCLLLWFSGPAADAALAAEAVGAGAHEADQGLALSECLIYAL